MTSRGALGLLLLLALGACSNYGGGSAVTLPPSAAASYKIGEAQNYTVIAGDTIDGVAQQFNMPVEALIAANHLVYPYALHAGQTLFIPGRGAPGAATGYVVVAGDTLTRIARHNGTTVAALAALNGLVPPYVIKVGQRLTVPGGTPTQTAAVAGAPASASAPAGEMIQFPPAQPAEPVPAAGSVKVATEALSTPPGASASPATQASEPAASQNAAAPPPVLLQPTKPAAVSTSKSTAPASSTEPAVSTTAGGTEVPAATSPSVSPAAPSTSSTLASNTAGAGAPTAAAPTTAPSTSGTSPLVPPPQAPAEVAAPAPRGSGKFLWPVNGKVVSVFGLKDGGQHNDGINIAAPLGTPVRAAENGVVVYAGNELRGFGNLLLIRHADGWVSAYAHCDALLVKRGDQVKRGQVIARVGQTGAVSSPQLHFELRKSGQAVDPTAELGPQGA
jgi:murein DD-endopeptidase MepM/ murein hydrolase activator NlpD